MRGHGGKESEGLTCLEQSMVDFGGSKLTFCSVAGLFGLLTWSVFLVSAALEASLSSQSQRATFNQAPWTPCSFFVSLFQTQSIPRPFSENKCFRCRTSHGSWTVTFYDSGFLVISYTSFVELSKRCEVAIPWAVSRFTRVYKGLWIELGSRKGRKGTRKP